MNPDQADALREAVNAARHTSRRISSATGRDVSTAIQDDNAAMAHLNWMISELTR